MKKRKKLVWGVLLAAAWAWSSPPAPQVQVTASPLPEMVWSPTANWLGCDQSSATPECAEYGTPTGGVIMMTCCVPRSALGTSDMSACADSGAGRGRTEL